MKGANDPRELAHLIMGQLSNACIVAIKPGLVLEYKHTEHCDASTKSIEEYARPAPAGEMVRREDVARWLELRAEQSTILRTGYCAIASMLRDGSWLDDLAALDSHAYVNDGEWEKQNALEEKLRAAKHGEPK
jgi:hypothetical protein